MTNDGLRHEEVEMSSRALSFNPRQIYDTLPLPRGSATIRVLDLDAIKAKESPKTPLAGHLRIVRLKDSPNFAALSYVWGDASDTPHVLSCRNSEGNKAKIKITRNCFEPLVSLRRQFGAITIWVDSICINQKDDLEKATQIPLMQEMYSYAQPTFIWLGGRGGRTEEPMSLIKKASSRRALNIGCPWFHQDKSISKVQDFFTLVLSLHKSWFKLVLRSKERLEDVDFSPLLEHLWLTRLWTFQEIILASDPVLFSETHNIDWGNFYQGLTVLHSDGLSDSPLTNHPWIGLMRIWRSIERPIQWNKIVRRQLPQNQSWSVDKYCKEFGSSMGFYPALSGFLLLPLLIFLLIILPIASTLQIGAVILIVFSILIGIFISGYCILSFCQVDKRCGFGHDSFEEMNYQRNQANVFSEVVRTLRERDVREPKDRSFATHAVFERLSISLPAPDLNKSLGYIYFGLFRALIADAPTAINLLVDAGCHNLDAPSWVPDWSALKIGMQIPDEFIYPPMERSSEDESENRRKAIPDCRVDGKKLICRGALIGKISFVTQIIPTPQATNNIEHSDLIHFSMELYEWLWTMLYTGNIEGSLRIPLSVSILKAIGFSITDKKVRSRLKVAFNTWYDKMLTNLVQKYHRGPPGLESAVKQFICEHPDAEDFVYTICRLAGGKRRLLFSPECGVGIAGTADITVGDYVVKVDGVSLPMILRKIDGGSNKYKVIGGSYMPLLDDAAEQSGSLPWTSRTEIVLV